jgi:hypothetical protein
MANDLDYAKLVKLAGQGMGHSAAAAEMGLAVSQISSLTFSQALVDSGQEDTAPATAKSVLALRHDQRNRWELIAARTGESVKRVKELYEEAGYDATSPLPPADEDEAPTPRRGNRKSAPARKSGSASKAASKKSGVKVVASKSKSKSKTAGAKTKASSARPRGRARTLAERRAARSSNPS